MPLDHEALWKRAEEMAQRKIDLLYPEEDEGIRATMFEKYRDRYYHEMVTPPSKAVPDQ